MAHVVKCLFCGKSFDRDKEPFVKVGARRYAHKACAGGQEEVLQEEKDKDQFYKCVKSIYGTDYNYMMINKQALSYINDYGYTWSGMTGCLHWFYNINHGSLEEGHGGIGIIPYIYDNVKKYYQQRYLTENKNKNKKMRKQVIEFNIVPPKPIKPTPRLLDLGDE